MKELSDVRAFSMSSLAIVLVTAHEKQTFEQEVTEETEKTRETVPSILILSRDSVLSVSSCSKTFPFVSSLVREHVHVLFATDLDTIHDVRESCSRMIPAETDFSVAAFRESVVSDDVER
jgi:hypothetical protein